MSLRALLGTLLIAAIAISLLAGGSGIVGAQTSSPRFFPDTGYTVADDAFWNYFQHRGGVDTFGQPVSRKFLLLGSEVQFFQRLVMQKLPDGSVTTLNLLDEGLMPVTHINGSTFPAPDPALAQAAPNPSQPDYGTKIIAFVRDKAPDRWNNLPVNFFSTFSSVVNLADAFPDGNGDPNLLPLLDLEIWGAPTSAPAFDPANKDFVYQRFQRVIAHYDRKCDCTRALLLADYFKSVLTGRDLPADLAQEMQQSRFFRQYDLSKPNGVARPDQLPASNLLLAFEREDRPVPNVPTVVEPAAPTSGTSHGGNTNGNDNSGATTEPVSAVTPGPSLGGVTVVSSELAQDPVTKHWIGFGEVENVTTSTMDVYATMNVFDAKDNLMASKEVLLGISPLAAGQVGTFRIDFGKLDTGVDHQTTQVRSVPPASLGVSGLKTSDKHTAHDKTHFLLTGYITNRSGDDVKNVQIGVSFYNKNKELLDVWQGAPVFDSIADGDQVAFAAASTLAPPDDVDSYNIYVSATRGHPSPKREADVAKVKNTSILPDGATLHVRGELSSTEDSDAMDLALAAVFYDHDGHVVSAGSAMPFPTRVRPKTTAPFELDVPAPPDGYDHVDYTVLGQRFPDNTTWPQPLKVTGSNLTQAHGAATVEGSVQNSSGKDLHDAFVVVTFYNAAGNVVDVVSTPLDRPSMGQGDKEAFKISSKASEVDSVRVAGFGYR